MKNQVYKYTIYLKQIKEERIYDNDIPSVTVYRGRTTNSQLNNRR